jgi:hypothetical protein
VVVVCVVPAGTFAELVCNSAEEIGETVLATDDLDRFIVRFVEGDAHLAVIQILDRRCRRVMPVAVVLDQRDSSSHSASWVSVVFP